MPKKFDAEIKARAVRMVRDHLAEYGSVTRTSAMVGRQLGISENTLRRWVVQADVDDGRREGVTTSTAEELAALRAENKRLRETNEILRRASIFFASMPGSVVPGRGSLVSSLPRPMSSPVVGLSSICGSGRVSWRPRVRGLIGACHGEPVLN